MMSALLELAQRIERLTGPDGRIDAEIACATKFPRLRPAKPDDHKEHLQGLPPGPSAIWCPTGFLMADSYTSSIDAAMSLVPDGCGLHLTRYWLRSVDSVWAASLFTGGVPGNPAQFFESEDAHSPALALTAAALRARAGTSNLSQGEASSNG